MANYDLLLAYDSEMEGYLRNEGCAVPSAGQKSRLPTIDEIVAAVESEGLRPIVDGDYIYVAPPDDAHPALENMTRSVKFLEGQGGQMAESPNRPPLEYLVVIRCFDWDKLNVDPKVGISMRGNFPLGLFLFHRLTERCGQLLVYPDPDTGYTPVILDFTSDIARLATVWVDNTNAGASWAEFYEVVNRPD